MQKSSHNRLPSAERGFSLLELLVVLLILGIVTGVLMSQIDLTQQRSFTEQAKLDYFQEGRDFVDQFFRDVNEAGYPNSRMVDTTSASWSPSWQSPLYNDSRLAMGLVKIADTEIIFEADSNGDGLPERIHYALNGSGSCSLCLQRSQVNKIDGNPLTGQSTDNWGTEVNDVDTANNSGKVFTYFDTSGNTITTPVDISTAAGRQTIATVKQIQIKLKIRNSAVIDLKTQQAIEAQFEGYVSLNNCSMAASGYSMSC